MNKLKLFLCVALFGSISYSAISAYEHFTMSDEELALLDNIEALTGDEIGARVDCSGSGSVYCPIDNKSEYKEVTYIQL